MNIFYLDRDPFEAAKFHCDIHSSKMLVEYSQLLSTAHRVLDGVEVQGVSKSGRKQKQWKLNSNLDSILYKVSHVNHPSAVWVRQSDSNYSWLYSLFIALGVEFRNRFGKHHKSYLTLAPHLGQLPKNISKTEEHTDPPLCMPDYCKLDDAVLSYRKLYNLEKSEFAKWNHSTKPYWYNSDKSVRSTGDRDAESV
jgi:hypothetical protein